MGFAFSYYCCLGAWLGYVRIGESLFWLFLAQCLFLIILAQCLFLIILAQCLFLIILAQSLLLGVDLVTLFDPTTSLQLKATEVKCKECATKIQDIQNKLPKTHFESNH